MNALQKEIDEILQWFKTQNLDIDIYKQGYEKKPADEPFRAYICCKILGGTLLVNHGDGWIPIYPEKPNYPMKGKWYGPSTHTWTPAPWRTALKACLDPAAYLHADDVGQKTAEKRAIILRDPFRTAVILAILREEK